MKAKIIFALFALLFVVQLAVPVHLGVRAEQTARQGRVFKFKCRPYDPRDLFRGHYLQLNIEDPAFCVPTGNNPESLTIDQDDYGLPQAYFTFEADAQGFARIAACAAAPVVGADNALKLVCRIEPAKKDKTARIIPDLPFSRFYLNEGEARTFENALRAAVRNTRESPETNTYLVVSIADGSYAVLDLVINGQSANALLRRGEKPLAYGARN